MPVIIQLMVCNLRCNDPDEGILEDMAFCNLWCRDPDEGILIETYGILKLMM
jgi:hypothetical protein